VPSKPKPSAGALGGPLPALLEVTADATHQGKTLVAHRLREHCEDAGIPVAVVRIESQRNVLPEMMRAGDVLIPSERFAAADSLPGGVAGVMRPAFVKVEEMARQGGVTIWDWAGGLGEHRLEIMVTTALSATLDRMGIRGVSVVVTTPVAACMAQARQILDRTAEVAPSMLRVLVLNANGRSGGFAFMDATEELGLLDAIETDASLAAVLHIPKVMGDSLAALRALKLGVRELIQIGPDQVS
jgi:hypothetical protein